MRGVRSIIACILLSVASVAAVGRADAGTVDTFSFTQNGYTGEPFDLVEQGSLSGTFTGTVESDGLIERGDLSSISYTFTETIDDPTIGNPVTSTGNVATFFSFNVEDFINNQSTSSFDFMGLLNGHLDNDPICVGAVAAFGQCGPRFSGIGVVFLSAATTEFPTITLVSSVTTTPLPPTWTMLIVGLGFFAYLGTKNRSAAIVTL
jgi:hypothetical protein